MLLCFAHGKTTRAQDLGATYHHHRDDNEQQSLLSKNESTLFRLQSHGGDPVPAAINSAHQASCSTVAVASSSNQTSWSASSSCGRQIATPEIGCGGIDNEGKAHLLSSESSPSLLVPSSSADDDTQDTTLCSFHNDDAATDSDGLGIATQLQSYTKVFQKVHQIDENDIDTALLLEACKSYHTLLKKIGNHQVAMDFQSNIRKVETVYQKAPAEARQTMSGLLAYEKATGCHGAAGRHFQDPSAAMGFLWLRRNLAVQYEMYTLVLDHDQHPVDAALQAYRNQVEPYFNWLARNAAKLVLQILTPRSRHSMFAKLGGFEAGVTFGEAQQAATRADLRCLLAVWRPLIAKWKQIILDLDLIDRV